MQYYLSTNFIVYFVEIGVDGKAQSFYHFFEVFYKKTSAPENQTVTGSQSYCDLGTECSGCKKYDYPVGRVPYINENQCNNVPVLPE